MGRGVLRWYTGRHTQRCSGSLNRGTRLARAMQPLQQEVSRINQQWQQEERAPADKRSVEKRYENPHGC